MKRLLIVVALLLLCAVTVKADQPTLGVRFESATLEEFTIVGVGTDVNACSVIINHAPPNETPQAGQWGVTNTNFVTVTMTWNDLGLADAVPGGCACLWWYCYDLEGMPCGTNEIGVISPYILYLPIVVKGDA